MTDIVSPVQGVVVSKAPERRDIGLKRRYAAERRFRAYGVAAISFGLICGFRLVRMGPKSITNTIAFALLLAPRCKLH